MSADRYLLDTLRRDRAGRFTATCTVVREDGEPVFDSNTGSYTNPTSQVYSGACAIRPSQAAPRVVETGGQAVTLRTYDVSLPADTTVVVDDVVTVTAAPGDDDLAGVTLTVVDVRLDEWQVARELVCQQNLGA